MTKPSSSLPVLYARVPVETYALAQLLATHQKLPVSQWIADLIESWRNSPRHQAAQDAVAPRKKRRRPIAATVSISADHEPGYTVAVASPVKRGRGRPRKVVATDREDAHERAAESACSSGDE